VSELHRPGDFAGGDIDDYHAVAVGSGLADAGVAVDRHVGRAAVGGRHHFVSGLAAFGHGGHLFAGGDIDNPEALVAFICHQKQTPPGGVRQHNSDQTKEHWNQYSHRSSPRAFSISDDRFAGSPLDIPHVRRDTPLYNPQESAWLKRNRKFCKELSI
jgi:hypothetical protein